VEILADPTCSITIPESRYQAIMNANGITVMCLDLIAVGIDAELSVAALKLLVALLAKNGGNPEVQQTVFNYLSETDSTLFFEHIKDLIEQQMLWCQREAESNNDKNDDAERIEMPDTVIVLKALHSICEGGFLRNKDLIREQNGNSRWVNLLDYLGSYADLMSRLESPVSARIGIRVLHTMLGLMQGPCKGNQEHFVLHTNLLSALNRIVRSSQSLLHYSAQWEADLETLKEYSIDVLQASVEGQPHNSVVLERVQISMELNVLNVLIMPSDVDEFGNVAEITDLTPLQAKYLVFLKALNCSDADIPANAKTPLKQEVASIEVIWNQQVHKHYFHLPSIAEDISESSKRRLVEEVDLSSQELKLKDFMRIARDLHREAVHHQNLKSYGISRVWNLKRNLSWVMLLNVFIINILLVSHFYVNSSNRTALPQDVDDAVFALVIIQLILAACALSVYLVVRVPVLYWSFIDNGQSKLWAIIFALTDPMPFWYICYLGVSILSLWKSYLFTSILLLDFVVMDSTSRDIMYAVVYPARQLATAIFIILIMVNVFAGIVFTFYRDEFDLDNMEGDTLWKTYKLAITYGVRANEGIGAYMKPNTSSRFVMDMFFYLIITVVLLNIFFGIIIDTFGKLRNLKVEREADEANRCFICGIDVHDFIKRGSAVSFKQHRDQSHNMWNYLYFAMLIWQQHRDYDNSVEMHVRKCMENGDVSWFPIGIQGDTEDSNETVEVAQETLTVDHPDTTRTSPDIRADFKQLSETLSEKISLIQERFITDTLKDPSPSPREGCESGSSTPIESARVGRPTLVLTKSESNPQRMSGDEIDEMMRMLSECIRQEIDPVKRRLQEVSDRVDSQILASSKELSAQQLIDMMPSMDSFTS